MTVIQLKVLEKRYHHWVKDTLWQKLMMQLLLVK